jgi:RTX calcium-binding nonapeptide repeat (4 copies)
MATIVVSDRRTTNSNFNLAVGDALLLTQEGSITQTSLVTATIVGAGGNSLTIDGDILMGAPSVLLLGAGAITVSDTGSLFGRGAIRTNGPTTLINAGQLIGSDDSVFTVGVLLNADGNSVTNSGIIYGSSLGLGIVGGGNKLSNYGLIEGFDSTAVQIDAGNSNLTNTIENFGRIEGRAGGIVLNGLSAETNNTIINWGTINGRDTAGISTSAGRDVITNRGVILGTFGVSTSGGNDIFDNSLGGFVSGVIQMGQGDDLVIAGEGTETISGDAGIDTISYLDHPRGILINLTGQVTTDGLVNDTLSSFENATGSRFNDQIYGDDQPNVLDGGPGGSDQIFGGGELDTVSYASAGRPVLINLAGQVTADGVDTDTLSSIENAIGSRFDDTIHGDASSNVLDGGVEGSDQIFGGLGLDYVSYATSPRAVLINLAGQVSSDGINIDTLSSIENAIGSDFDDTIVSSDGPNAILGGSGRDTVSYIASKRPVTIDLATLSVNDGLGTTDSLLSIENATGSDFNDIIVGDPLNNVLDGGPGGADQINGGDGNDTVSYASLNRAVLINIAGGVSADGIDTDTLSAIENAIGSRLNDILLGDALDNVLDGGSGGQDHIAGGGGADTVSYASSSLSVLINLAAQAATDGLESDTLSSIENARGSNLNDTIISRDAVNIIDGGFGNDTVS